MFIDLKKAEGALFKLNSNTKTQTDHTWIRKLFCTHPLGGLQPNGSQCRG